MKKIIVKCKLNDPREFELKLHDAEHDFGPVFWQHDRVYWPRGFKRNINYPCLIMRTEIKDIKQPPEYQLIIKRHISDSDADIIHLTPILEYTEATHIIHQLGFIKKAEVSRQRQVLKMGEDTIINLDKVEGLASTYAKIEARLNDGESATAVREDLVKTLAVLGETEITEITYAELLAQKA